MFIIIKGIVNGIVTVYSSLPKLNVGTDFQNSKTAYTVLHIILLNGISRSHIIFNGISLKQL